MTREQAMNLMRTWIAVRVEEAGVMDQAHLAPIAQEALFRFGRDRDLVRAIRPTAVQDALRKIAVELYTAQSNGKYPTDEDVAFLQWVGNQLKEGETVARRFTPEELVRIRTEMAAQGQAES